ncbi:hypothetical protein A3711_15920 [Erythrobacter sp. HI00D59]|nr:hypothetical protein A3711_15920 [Erythrobacter sp. HI00D59]
MDQRDHDVRQDIATMGSALAYLAFDGFNHSGADLFSNGASARIRCTPSFGYHAPSASGVARVLLGGGHQ